MDVPNAEPMGGMTHLLTTGEGAVTSGVTVIAVAATDSSAAHGSSSTSEEAGHNDLSFDGAGRSCDPTVSRAENQSSKRPSKNNTHVISAANDVPQNQPTAGFVLTRAAELFPGGTGTPAIGPQQPPVVVEFTYELAELVFAASKKVKQIRGVLAREDIAGYLAADLMGIELVGEARGPGRESLKIGESVRKAALALEQGEKAEKNSASAKKSRMRTAAAKDAAREARLDEDLQDLNDETAAACAKLRQAKLTLNGMPKRETVVVKRRRVEPAPVDLRRNALEAMWGSQEAIDAINAADRCEDAECDWTQHDSDDDEDELKDKIELAFLHYKQALRRLKKAFPDELNDCSEEGACEHRRPCPCGRGKRGAWPWVVQTPARGFCEVPRESRPAGELRGMFSCGELHEERQRWVWANAWVGPDKAAERAERGYEHEYRALYSRLRSELY